MNPRLPLLALLALIALPAHAAGVTSTSVRLLWTASGDDSLAGRASGYDLRFSTAPITAVNFLSASRFLATPAPALSGAADSCTVTGLAPSTGYWFALKAFDDATPTANYSLISNIAQATTLAPPDVTPPAAVLDLRVGP